MKYCTNCGKQIDDSVSFCPFCGTSQGEQETTLLLPMVVPQPGMQQQDYSQQGFTPVGMQGGYGQSGMQQGFSQAGMQGGYGQPGMQQGFNQAGMQGGYGQPGMQQGFNQAGMQGGFVQSAYGQQTYMPKNAAYKKPGFFSKIPKPLLIIVPIVVVALVVLIIFFATRRGASNYEAAIEDYFDALASGDPEKVFDVMMPASVEDQFYDALENGDVSGFRYDTLEEAIENDLDEYLDSEIEFRAIRIEDKEKISKSELRSYVKSMKREAGVEMNMTAAYEVDVEYQYRERGDKRWESEEDYFVVYEIDGRWYVSADLF